MAPSPLQQRRLHNALLFQKLLSLRDGASPFTLVLDTLEQSGGPVVREFARRAKISKSKILLISFCTNRRKVSFEVDVFISTTGKSLSTLRTEILSNLSPPATTLSTVPKKTLLIIDTLNPISSNFDFIPHLSSFLSSLLVSPLISLLAIYHLDIPLPLPSHYGPANQYNPDPLTTLTFLATAILRIESLSHTIAKKKARDRSVQEPEFGLVEGREGIIFGMRGEKVDGAVVEMELRRKSGRGVAETFVLIPSSTLSQASSTQPTAKTNLSQLSTIILLDEYPLFASTPCGLSAQGLVGEEGEEVEMTFNLGLTKKQKRDREGVVLPYFDAQKEGGALGAGEGGRILYEMGSEDREDFDDEEDEI